MLQQLLRRAESLAAVRLAGDPIADVWPAAGQRGRIGQRRGRHRAQRRQRHGQTVLLMIALGATARTAARAHHDLGAVHAVLATVAIGILADRDQGFAAGRSLDAGVSQVRIAAGRIGRRIAEQRCRGGMMMREGRRAREGRPEGGILGQTGRTAQRIAGESWKTLFVSRQIRVLCVRAGEDLHPGSDNRTGAVVIVVIIIAAVVAVVAGAPRRTVCLFAISWSLPVDRRRAARDRRRRLAARRRGLSANRRTIAGRFLVGMRVITNTDTILTTDTVHTGLGRGSALVRGLLRHDIGLVRLERQRLAVRRTAARVAFHFRGRRRFRVRGDVYSFRILLQGRY